MSVPTTKHMSLHSIVEHVPEYLTDDPFFAAAMGKYRYVRPSPYDREIEILQGLFQMIKDLPYDSSVTLDRHDPNDHPMGHMWTLHTRQDV